MDQYLLDRVRGDTPLINPDIANGLAVKYVPYAEQYIDSVWKSVAKAFPEGFEYVGCRRCTPYEEFNQEPKKKNDRQVFDIAPSQIYLMQYHFRWQGVDLEPHYTYLPYVSEAGAIMLGGSRFFFSPVLSDIIMSYEIDNIFVVLLRDKFSIRRLLHDMTVNGVRNTVEVAWSMIYHMNKEQRKQKRVVRAECSLMHYLLCRYGFTETFQRFGHCTPIIGSREITPEEYPPDKWVICETNQLRKPKGVAGKSFYQPTDIKIVVRKEDFTPMVKSMIAAFFYIVDHFPHRMLPEFVDEVNLWKILFGHILFGSNMSEGRLHDDVDEHIRSLDEYMDTMMVSRFKEIGLVCEDIYQFFAIAIERFNTWMLDAPNRVNSLYDKELSVLYYMFLSLTTSIFRFHFKLKTAAKKGLTVKEIQNIRTMHLKPKGIFGLTKQPPGISNMSYSGDNKFMKITSVMVPQKHNKGGVSGDDSQALSDSSKQLHTSFAVVGNYSNLPKSNPTGDGRVNPHLRLDENARVIPDPDTAALMAQVQEKLSRNQSS